LKRTASFPNEGTEKKDRSWILVERVALASFLCDDRENNVMSTVNWHHGMVYVLFFSRREDVVF
jgi:hypothetical protein